VLYVNSFVHVVMYCYYFLTSMWPEYRNNLWWKKYITQLQMVNNININSMQSNCLFSSLTFKCNLHILVFTKFRERSQDSVVGIATGLGVGRQGVRSSSPGRVTSPSSPDRIWGPPNRQSIEYWGLFPWV
jgi:hypothetical protein